MIGTRRTFLKHVSAVTAAGLLAQVPTKRLWGLTPAELLPAPDEALLRDLAHRAMDATRAAGASFADIRITVGRAVTVACQYTKDQGPRMKTPAVAIPTGYCIRAIVNGAWGVATGTVIDPDLVVETARTAAAVARANKPRRPRTIELAPIDTITNAVWSTPIEQDPLDISIGAQGDLGLEAVREAGKSAAVIEANALFHWRRPTTVFAATDGTTITFRYATAMPGGLVRVLVDDALGDSGVEGLREGPYGYEALGKNTIVTGMRPAVERAIEDAKTVRTPTSVDVGRYDIVFSAEVVASLLATTLVHAVDAELALGYRANNEGTSFAAPPLDMVGKYQAASPLVTIHCDRTRPDGAATVGWDAEGVKPRRYTVIDRGVITDYHTTRDTAPSLGPWYQRRGEPVRAHGIARRSGWDRPRGVLPNLTMEAAPDAVALDDMIKGVKKGLYVEGAFGRSDQQVINTQFGTDSRGVRYITNGKLGQHVKDAAFQFNTTPFWKSVDAIGGRTSVKTMPVVTDMWAQMNVIEAFPLSTFELVPIRARQVNVLNTGRTA